MLKTGLKNVSTINARRFLKSHLVSFPKHLELSNYKLNSFNSIQNKLFFNFSSDEPPKGFESFKRKKKEAQQQQNTEKKEENEQTISQEEPQASKENNFEQNEKKEQEMDKNTKKNKEEDTHDKKENINFGDQKKKSSENSIGSKTNDEKWRYFFIFAGLYFLFGTLISNYNESFFFTYTEFIQNFLEKNLIEKIIIAINHEGAHYTAEAHIITKDKSSKKKLMIGNLNYFLENLEKFQIETLKKTKEELIPIEYYYPFVSSKFLEKAMSVLVSCASIALGIYFYKFAKNAMNMGKKNNDIFGIGKSKVNLFGKETNIKTKFQDVAGLDEAKLEISEFVEFLKNPKKYQQIGARLPRGALLAGPPGTGKTMLAKACAGEAGVPFFYMAGSDFVEMFVGVGAARVRELFANAKKKSPCIIFLDEIDAVGKKRESRFGGNDERDNTLNQLLVEMDGFETDSQVIVLAATNRIELLDSALTRPGRFDRTIEIPLPDISGRFQIFLVHLQPLKLNPERTIEEYAKRLATLTPGFSGADIANLCNEAAIIAARKGKNMVESSDFEIATERVLAGLEKNKIISEEEKKTVAFHESGHAVVSWFLEGGAPLLKLTIIPRSKGSLGYAQYLPNESALETKEELIDRICCVLGGRCSEEFFFNKITTGAYDDLEKAFKLSHNLVTKLGMSEKIGFIGFSETEFQKSYSEETQKMIDLEIQNIIKLCTEKTKETIKQHKTEIEKLANALLEKETLDLRAIIEILGERPFPPKSNFKAYLESKSSQDKEQKEKEEKHSQEPLPNAA